MTMTAASYPLMALSPSAYVVTLGAQNTLIALDICMNELSNKISVRLRGLYLLILFIVQDICIILAVIVFCHSLFRTYVFKAGFVRILLNRFRYALFVLFLYLIISICLQTYILVARWHRPLDHTWPTGLPVLFTFHRIVAVFYYYCFKRASLRLSDARYYDEEWVKHSLTHQ